MVRIVNNNGIINVRGRTISGSVIGGGTVDSDGDYVQGQIIDTVGTPDEGLSEQTRRQVERDLAQAERDRQRAERDRERAERRSRR